MEGNIVNPIERLKKYFIILKTYDYFLYEEFNVDYAKKGVTLSQLEELCDIPQKVIYEDFKTFLSVTSGMLKVGGDDSDKQYDICNEKVERKIIDNKIGFSIASSEKSFIQLTSDESKAIKAFFNENDDLKNVNKEIVFKEGISFRHFNTNFSDNLFTLTSLMPNQCYISFKYNHNGRVKNFNNIYPLKIMYDTEDNIYSILCIHGGIPSFFRIDYIVDKIKQVPGKRRKSTDDLTIEEKELLKIVPYIWGFKCRKEDRVGKVKIAFRNEGQVWDKVWRNVEYRTKKKLYVDKGYLIYEDTVYGKDNFKNWILGFGSSAIVDKPVSLRNEIVELMKKRLGEA